MSDRNIDVNDIKELFARIRAGDAQAADVLCNCYGDTILYVIRKTLNYRLQSKLDPEDVAQSLWGSFWRRRLEHNFENVQQLRAYLQRMARNKALEENRHFLKRQAHDVQREQPLEDNLVTHQTPEQIILAKDKWRHLLETCAPHERKIMDLLRAGFTFAQIATRIGTDEKTLRRLFRIISSRGG